MKFLSTRLFITIVLVPGLILFGSLETLIDFYLGVCFLSNEITIRILISILLLPGLILFGSLEAIINFYQGEQMPFDVYEY